MVLPLTDWPTIRIGKSKEREINILKNFLTIFNHARRKDIERRVLIVDYAILRSIKLPILQSERFGDRPRKHRSESYSRMGRSQYE